MSWGEVKKINSNLNIPLDKKLDSLSTKINSNLNVPLDKKLDSLSTKINSNLNVPLNEFISNLKLDSGGVKVIKSAQMGVVNETDVVNTNRILTVPISAIDPSKALIQIMPITTYVWYYCCLTDIQATYFCVNSGSGGKVQKFSYRILEFY